MSPSTSQPSSKYCSKHCQESDWPSHKLLCKSFREFHPPFPDACRAIFFPEDTARPYWIPLRRSESGVDSIEEVFEEFLAAQGLGGEWERYPIRSNNVLGRELNKGYSKLKPVIKLLVSVAAYGDGPDGTSVNRSVISATNGLCSMRWRGSKLAYGCSETDAATLYQFSTSTWKIFGSSVTISSSPSPAPAELHSLRPGRIQRTISQGRPEFERVSVPMRHNVFDLTAYLSDDERMSFSRLSERVQMDVQAWKVRMDPEYVTASGLADYLINPGASALFFGPLDTDKRLEAQDWDRPARRFEGEIGSVIIVRRLNHGVPLSIYHAE
ncbi:hypothetical protein NA57DRAFT_53323 [Rhizodiscina lignyota]|uniref:MYND-type domain-containing protein n=1 Tax=Rhizodiscina lignyota TaxID=1504668 RepID=A0A9P4M8S3_9PEZI|nr:hypothetical protein NA57DRAFT_53323 [Rhizodiscina lignyota]